MRTAASEERRRFFEASLTTTQLAEAGESVDAHARPADCELVARVGQLPLRFIPRTAPHAHRAVLRAAHGEERLEPPLAAVRLDSLAPLHGATVIADAIARAE